MTILTSYILIDSPMPDETPSNDYRMYEKLQHIWSSIRFDAVDHLHIGPFNVWKKNGKFMFGMGEGCTEDNPLGVFAERYTWIVKRARAMNPHIKIIPMQMYGSYDYASLADENHDTLRKNIEEYTKSVAHFVQIYKVDGYDVDYEWKYPDRDVGSGNYQKYAPYLLRSIRHELDSIQTSPRLLLSVSAADTTCLAGFDVMKSLDYFKMQNYDGGWPEPVMYINGFKSVTDGKLTPQKLVYGISSEMPHKNNSGVQGNLQKAVEIVRGEGYAGIMTWRLNSDNIYYQNAVQVWLHNQFRDHKLTQNFTDEQVLHDWAGGGYNGGRLNGETVHPWVRGAWK